MALAWTLTDSQAKNIYSKLCNYYNSPELPSTLKDTGVFFGYANFTRDKLYYCIEFMKKNFGRGWFSTDGDKRREIIGDLANELYNVFSGSVDVAGIKKFLNWVYSFAQHDAGALKYFQGGGYSVIDTVIDAAKDNVLDPITNAVETIAYGVNYPVLSAKNPVLLWGAVGLAALGLYKLLK